MAGAPTWPLWPGGAILFRNSRTPYALSIFVCWCDLFPSSLDLCGTQNQKLAETRQSQSHQPVSCNKRLHPPIRRSKIPPGDPIRRAGKMKTVTLLAIVGALPFASSAWSQTQSRSICSAALTYLATANRTPRDEGLFVSGSLSARSAWVPLTQAGSGLAVASRTAYLAYFFSAPFVGPSSSQAAGAMSIKVSVLRRDEAPKARSIEAYRSEIPRGSNRCEPRGRREITNRRVPINEYIDFHERRGSSSDLEDFHFRYPYGTDQCANTNRPAEVAATFQFPNVRHTTGDTVVARVFGQYFGQAYAVNHDFSQLRTELHYYRAAGSTPACVGFHVPFNGSGNRASILIHDLSSNWFSHRGSWLIHR